MDPARLHEDEMRWLVMDEQRWARAHAIAARHPDLDLTDIYHTLVNFEREPTERLARGLRRGLSRADGG